MARGKRPNGDGTVYRRKDGRWTVAVSFKDPATGVTRRRVAYASTQKVALDKRRQLIQQRSTGTLVGPARETVGEFLEMWLRDVVAVQQRPATLKIYRSLVAHHIVPRIGQLRLDRLRPEHVDRIQREALEAHLAPRTVVMIRATLAVALKTAVERGYVGQNVVTKVAPPHVDEGATRVVTADEAKRLLAAAAGDRFEAGYALALYLGLRIGEVLGLRWQDVDWKKKRIHVRVQLEHRGPPPVLADVKTKTSRRTLPLVLDLETMLRSLRAQQLAERLEAPGQLPDYDLVFTRADGEAYGEEAIRAGFRRILKTAGLPRMKFHGLRHACATLLADAGVSPRISMAILGHASIKVNQEVYTHIMEDGVVDAVSTMAGAITGADGGDMTPAATPVAINGRKKA